MNVNRRQFGLVLTASRAGLTAAIATQAHTSQDKPAGSSNNAASTPHYFFKRPTFEIISSPR